MLLIDEAAGLAGSTFSDEVFKTMVEKISALPEDRAVIMCGYEGEIMEMLRKADPGLKSRFNAESRFVFPEYDMEQLEGIVRKTAAAAGHTLTEDGVKRAMAILRMRKRCDANFSNARAAQLIVYDAVKRHNAAKAAAAGGSSGGGEAYHVIVLGPDDFGDAPPDPLSAFDGLVAVERVVEYLKARRPK